MKLTKSSIVNKRCERCNRVCDTLYAHYFEDGILYILEWIPYCKFYNIEYIVKREFDGVYIANWIDGSIVGWDEYNKNWKRERQNMVVILKCIDLININMGNLINIAKFIKKIVPHQKALDYIITPFGEEMIIIDPPEKEYCFDESKIKNKIIVYDKVYGITRDPETKHYMLVLNYICEKCECACGAIHFQENLNNQEIRSALEWIPYNRFFNVEYIAKGGFGIVYRANWIDGFIDGLHNQRGHLQWVRRNRNILVALKILDNSQNVTLEFMNEITSHHKLNNNVNIIKLYGISQDPETKNYIMVLEYAMNKDLRNYLDINYNTLSWSDKFLRFCHIAAGLVDIHRNELIHRDLHIGNVLVSNYTKITDMRLCKPASDNAKNNIYGVLSYVAPEILRGQSYTKASDVYSFGIIMYEVISGLPPYHDVRHDEILAIEICRGLRPRFNIRVPQLVVHLIKRCLDADPLDRPTSKEIEETMEMWWYSPTKELQEQIEEADEFNSNLPSTSLRMSNGTHPEAIYISRLLSLSNELPEPTNSNDYYIRNDNIISEESLGSV
ncbi:kinase-like domain-containing protein [Rhizophagus clarus]|uniref:Kinase-like domain-containing protein n=1 Tax=Rhizophagus clarus TaxID=94130 RepID=A0A8H3LKD5_9GLOM|nr:kinase-like domain-containing protein [Rhizophagus clarus]